MCSKKISNKKILLIREGIYEIIKLGDVFYVESNDTKVIFHTMEGEFYSSESLQALENKLNTLNFYRVHRSYLVNMATIKKVKLVGDRTYAIEFNDYNKIAYVSRNRFKDFINKLEKRYLTIKRI
ncbi:MAG: LytTR family transcriptional regulator [Halanaerobiales bacterium]|nr:LytTR family transcriptional regulator [Halanaerobiales bacterium]